MPPGLCARSAPTSRSSELGDEVYYAGSITRPGTNAEFHLVDARIVGHKPASLSWAEAAALPLTTLTAWEAMFDRLDVAKPVPGAARRSSSSVARAGLGRSPSDRATAHGPHRHRHSLSTGNPRVGKRAWSSPRHRPFSSLAPQIAELGIGAPAFVFSTTHTEQHVADIAELIAHKDGSD